LDLDLAKWLLATFASGEMFSEPPMSAEAAVAKIEIAIVEIPNSRS
jgi:hypothetical protein